MNGCIADSTPDGIALDIHSRLLFYTDTGKKVIGVTSLDISYHATLISKGLDQPRAIAADPGRGYALQIFSNTSVNGTRVFIQIHLLE